jgi:signal transduction histidine kinase
LSGGVCKCQTESLLTLDTTLFTVEEWSEVLSDQDELVRSYAELKIKDLNGVPFSDRERQLLEIYKAADQDSPLKLLTARTLAGEYSLARQIDSAKKYCAICIDLAGNYVEMRELCRINGASAYRFNAEYSSALAMIDQALLNLESIGKTSTLGLAYMAKGNYYHHKHVLDSAMEFYTKSAQIYLQTQDSSRLAGVYNNLGIVLSSSGDLDKARAFYKKSLAIKLEVKSGADIAQSYLSLGNIKLDKQEWDSANYYYKIADSIYSHFDHKQGQIWAQNNLANSAYYSENYNDAKGYFLNSLSLAKQLNDSVELCRLYSNLGWSYISLDSLSKAKSMFDIGAEIGNQLESYELQEQAHVGLSDYFIAIEDYKSALDEYVLSREAHDKMINAHRLSEVERLEARFSSREKELRIARLDEKQAQDSLSIARQRFWIFGLMASLIIAIGGGGFLIYRRRKRAQEQLTAQKLSFQKKILDSTVEAQENERQRIAKDLHDGLVQSLAVLKLGVQNALNNKASEKERQQNFEEHIKQIDQAADEARSISHQMMPRTLLEMGMIPAIEEMLNKTLGQTSIRFRFDHYALDEERFPRNIEISLYRICQELVNNIMKHSGATEVDVQVYKTKTHLILHVEDNGKGLKSQMESKGLGMDNIYSRAGSINGEVQYQAGEASGTVASVRVPI